jgi:hypothetical protein
VITLLVFTYLFCVCRSPPGEFPQALSDLVTTGTKYIMSLGDIAKNEDKDDQVDMEDKLYVEYWKMVKELAPMLPNKGKRKGLVATLNSPNGLDGVLYNSLIEPGGETYPGGSCIAAFGLILWQG